MQRSFLPMHQLVFCKLEISGGVLQIRSEPRACKGDMQPYQIRYFGLNGAVQILLRFHLGKKCAPHPNFVFNQNPQGGLELSQKLRDPNKESFWTKFNISEITSLTKFSSELVYSKYSLKSNLRLNLKVKMPNRTNSHEKPRESCRPCYLTKMTL